MKKRFKKVYIEITNICNLSCPFCEPDNRKKEYMQEDKFIEIIEKVKTYTDYIYLHVKGEPLIHPKINEFIQIATDAGLKVNLTTNGTLLDKLKNRNVRQINYSIQSGKTVLEIQNIIKKLKEIANENNTYISLRLWRNDTKENKEIEEMLKKEFPNIEQLEDRKTLSKNIFLSIEEEFEWPSLENVEEEQKGYCYGLLNQLAILVDGTIVPCCLDHKGIINLGNIFQDDLDNILESKRAKEICEGFNSRKVIEQLCKKCKYKSRFER